MWGLGGHTPWHPWPNHWHEDARNGGTPEVLLLEQFADALPVITLVGANASGKRGRLGVVGLALHPKTKQPTPTAIKQLFDDADANAFRVILTSYESGRACVHLPNTPPPGGQPALWYVDLPAVLVVDHEKKRWTLWRSAKADPKECRILQGAAESATNPQAKRAEPPASSASSESSQQLKREPTPKIHLIPAVDNKEHAARIRQAQAHIAAGNIYQANVTRTLHLKTDGHLDAVQTLKRLTCDNPVAHGAYICTPEFSLLSNSMETLLHYNASTRRASSFPIKGTKPQTIASGSSHDSDTDDMASLRNDPKEQAEHVMIVDLVRHDLGQVAEPHSMAVPTLMGIEPYRHLWHGVSEITCTLRSNATLGDMMTALLPGGSISGAPKRRAVQVLHEIENQQPRGFYTGSLAVVTPDGSCSASLLIRTLVRDANGWTLGVGGGIVADSVPENEIKETWNKVQVFQNALVST